MKRGFVVNSRLCCILCSSSTCGLYMTEYSGSLFSSLLTWKVSQDSFSLPQENKQNWAASCCVNFVLRETVGTSLIHTFGLLGWSSALWRALYCSLNSPSRWKSGFYNALVKNRLITLIRWPFLLFLNTVLGYQVLHVGVLPLCSGVDGHKK